MSKKYTLPKARLSFPFLLKPRITKDDAGKDKEPEYSATFILYKGNSKHAAIIADMEAEAKRLAIDKWGKCPKTLRMPFRDGGTFVDKETDEGKKGFCEEPCWGIIAKNNAKPDVVDQAVKHITDATEIYGGCFVNAVISLFAWEHPTNGRGVSANLGCVQKVKDGEPFGRSAFKAEQEFTPIEDDDDDDDAGITL